MDTEQLYKDIKARTNGEIYIGVVGPVRTGKSTFIKRFMDVMVLPRMEDEHKKERTRDELPQSAAGKTIMTTEPKFVPKDAAVIRLNQDVEVRIRLIDCVGYMVKGASGHEEAGHERMVKTPWYQEEIPFTKAAVIGTQKVIHEHATIGIVVTTDGTITDILPENYEDAEARTIRELQSIRKPFVVLVNSKKPHGQEAKEKAKKLEDTYGVKAMTVNCEQIKEEDIYRILEAVLYEFPISEVQLYTEMGGNASGYTQDQTGPSGTYTKNPRTPGRDQRCGSFNRKTGKSIHKRLVCRTDTDGYRLCYHSDPHV